MKKVLYAASSFALALSSTGISASTGGSPTATPTSGDSAPQSIDDWYCDEFGRCCPIWLINANGQCMDSPIGD